MEYMYIFFFINNRAILRTAARAAFPYVTGTVSQKNEFQIISDVDSSRKRSKC